MKTPSKSLPPAVRAILNLGGPTEASRVLGGEVTRGMVESWMRSHSIPLGYLRRVARLARIPLEEFYAYEESKTRG